MKEILWKAVPETHDYDAAKSYLKLVSSNLLCEELVEKFNEVEISEFKAKDILRASRLPLLDKDNFHVAKDLKKIDEGKELSPILLIAGNLENGTPLTIADGYHRVCALYHNNEDSLIKCKIISF